LHFATPGAGAASAARSCTRRTASRTELNERVPVATIDGALVQWRSLIRDLSR
jgi:hypothetical protein